jgi:hypothetical protein
MRKLIALALAASCLAIVPSTSAGPSASKYPSAMVVLGGATAAGYSSDPAHPYSNAQANSWATGANPAVQSVYSRILAVNPQIKGRDVNLADHFDATEVDELARLASKAVTLQPKPDLVVIEVVERNNKCNGSSETNYADYGAKIAAALDTITKGLPKARIFVVSQWGSFASYTRYLNALPEGPRLKHAGKGPCQLVDGATKRVSAQRTADAQKIVAGEEAQLHAACAKLANCRYDGGAAQSVAVTAADVSPFQFTPSVQGQAKLAAAEWKAMAGWFA